MKKTITDHDIYNQVSLTLPGFEDEFDIEAITRDIIAEYGLMDIEDIDGVGYWAIVGRHCRHCLPATGSENMTKGEALDVMLMPGPMVEVLMSDCAFGCKVYERVHHGHAIRAVMHSAIYGCGRGADPDRAVEIVSF